MDQVNVGRDEAGLVLDSSRYVETALHNIRRPLYIYHRERTGMKKMAVQVNSIAVEKLGFIGLGVMGEAMCLNLATRVGMPVLGYDLRPEPLQRLAEAGVAASASIAELAGECELVFICLASDKQVEAACFGSDGITQRSSRVKVIVD